MKFGYFVILQIGITNLTINFLMKPKKSLNIAIKTTGILFGTQNIILTTKGWNLVQTH